MEPEVLTMLLGIALAALVAACGVGFKWMRTDFRDLRSHIDSRFTDHITTTNERFAEVNRRLDRLENRFDGLERRFDSLEHRFDSLEHKFDDLIMALARAGLTIEPRPVVPPPPPPAAGSTAGAQPPESAQAASEAPEDRALPSETSSEIADPPRAPPATGGQPSADHPARRPPPELFGPTAAPA
ncbi:MAG: hypothetical protein F4Z26_01105 [Acidimicrobiaceae bacterium]|nr:hypothetical protein [Acidimicrobiaceae bacterium]